MTPRDILSANAPQTASWSVPLRERPAERMPDSAVFAPRTKGIAGIVTRWWQARVQPARHLRLVESLALGPRRSVALLELDGQRFLAGMGADGVTTLLQVNTPVQKADQP